MINNLLGKFKRDYRVLNLIEISKNNLLSNYRYLSLIDKKVRVALVLKSNAYGHGINIVAKILDPVNAPYFCVDSLYEAYELLKLGIKTPILIMGYTDPGNLKVKQLPFSYALFDLETTQVLNKYQPGCKVHIFVDTGMNREGVKLEDLPELLKALKQFKNLTIDGLMSHFASSDDKKDPLNKMQIKNFKKALEIIRKSGFNPKWIHLQNSDGLALHLKGVNVNLARTGIALYGISKKHKLKPVLSLKSKIIQIKKINTQDRVGYNGIFRAEKQMTLGILPIGYYDGVDRNLSNIGFVQVNDKYCKYVGRISMNICAIDLTNIKNPKVGQEVIIYSGNPKDKNSIINTAKLCGKIPYEILVNLASSIKRVII